MAGCVWEPRAVAPGIFAVEGNAMVVAEELGLDYEDVFIDFDYNEPFAPVGGGSDGTTASAWVTKECANILKKRILEAAIENAENPPPPSGFGPPQKPEPNPLKGYTPEDLDMGDGNVYVKSDPGKALPLAKAVGQAHLFADLPGQAPHGALGHGHGKISRHHEHGDVRGGSGYGDRRSGNTPVRRGCGSRKGNPDDIARKPDRTGNEFQHRVPASGRFLL